MLLENISLIWNFEIILQENKVYLIHLFLFLGEHLSTHCFRYLGHLSIFFSILFFHFFCIAPHLFFATELWERYQQELGAFIWLIKKPNKHVFFVHPQCRSKMFLGRSKWKACFYTYSQCRSSAYLGGVYVILILRAWPISHKGQQSLTKLNAK